jgi:putative transposase
LLRLVDTAPLSVRRCLKTLELPKSTYYRWLHRQTLQDHPSAPKRVWNQLRDEKVAAILVYALEYEDLSPRELAFKITDEGSFSVSESTVYRILKKQGLTRQYPTVIPAAKEFHRKTTRPNELWQTDLTELVLPDWGKHVLGGVLDDHSRFSIVFRRLRSAKGDAVQELIAEAVAATGMETVPRCERVHLLSDNGACYIWKGLKVYLKSLGIKHIFSMRNHPQTNGKAERFNRTIKDHLTLTVHASPEAFDRALEEYRHWYNYEHYHEGIGNLHPADVYYGRADAILEQRKQLKEQTKKARKKANLQKTKNPRKNRHLRAKTLH